MKRRQARYTVWRARYTPGKKWCRFDRDKGININDKGINIDVFDTWAEAMGLAPVPSETQEPCS